MSNNRDTIYLQISTTDGRNKLEQFINTVRKKSNEAATQFGVDFHIERVTRDEIESAEFSNDH